MMTGIKTSRPISYIRLREEDRQLLKELAKKLDISESDVVKLGLKKLAQEWGVNASS